MKLKDIANNFGVDAHAFEAWLPSSGYTYKVGFAGGIDVDDSQNMEEVVAAFRRVQFAANQQAEQAAAAAAKAAAEKQQALASMLITSGFNFDGFTITKYSGYISGDDVVSIGRGTSGIFSNPTDVGSSLMESLVHIRRNALNELKEAAYALGCNAVIGVDFDYLTLDPETANSNGGTTYLPYVFGVTANGNAVNIEPTKRTAG
jgi:uncharacterized protein YbjQ (UPF0145 family)